MLTGISVPGHGKRACSFNLAVEREYVNRNLMTGRIVSERNRKLVSRIRITVPNAQTGTCPLNSLGAQSNLPVVVRVYSGEGYTIQREVSNRLASGSVDKGGRGGGYCWSGIKQIKIICSVGLDRKLEETGSD